MTLSKLPLALLLSALAALGGCKREAPRPDMKSVAVAKVGPVIHEDRIDPKRIDAAAPALAQTAAKEGRRLLLFFHAGWCGACRELEPAFARESNRGTFQHWSLVRVDVDQLPEDWDRILGLSFDEIPYLIKLDATGKVAGTLPPDEAGIDQGPAEVDKRLQKFLGT